VNFIKNIIKAILRDLFGLDLHRSRPISSLTSVGQLDARHIACSLRKFEIDLVLDVGANRGQFASKIRQFGYNGRIVSFEPLSQAHSILVQASAADSMWHVYPRCAIGAHEGQVEINVAGNSDSSSILPMLELHLMSAPESAYRGREAAPMSTLDKVAPQYLKDANAAFLKIDTQGFEWEVLDGAKEILPRIQGIQLELSLVPLYEGQHLWQELIARLESEGFTLWALEPAFSSPLDGRTLQIDGIFYRFRQS
jgi:FkbM family methyltransferase